MSFAGFDWRQVVETLVSLIAAYLLALPLALEREARGRSDIGLRTVPLVSVGACGYLLITRFLYDQGVFDADGLARTLRSVMTGIGFIGGGAIVKQATEVQGLATGAAVWSAGAIGGDGPSPTTASTAVVPRASTAYCPKPVRCQAMRSTPLTPSTRGTLPDSSMRKNMLS